MKKQERYKILNYARNQYNDSFTQQYEFKNLSKKCLHNILKKYKHSVMVEWSYCCNGLYQNCWQELFEEGNWGMTQNDVDMAIKNTINDTAKHCRKDKRILYCEGKDGVHVVIVMRDIHEMDYLIYFTNEEG